MKTITQNNIDKFTAYLVKEEKSNATVSKYIHDVTAFYIWIGENEITKEKMTEYKKHLTEQMMPRSVNSVISSLNSFMDFMNYHDCKVKTLKIQRKIFAEKDKELTKAEYERLLKAAKEKNNERLYLLMQTICACGIRVSELKYITTEAVHKGQGIINCKGKMRTVFLPSALCKILKEYIKKHNIKSGSVFVSKNGKPLDRSNIWSDMKKLCKSAGVSKDKVFPHNLRHLFARTFYSLQKDIVRLADILGHSSIETTRIYTMENGDTHRKLIKKCV